MPSIPVIAILDVGKTNKKLLLLDEDYQIVWGKSDLLPETKDEDGDSCEDLNLLNTWAFETLKKAVDTGGFRICAINFCAYGASFVHIDQNSNSLTPLYSYLKPYPEPLKDNFYEQYGGKLSFSMTTASPVLGSLNSGMQLYRLKKENPGLFAQIKYSLHLPQYLSYLFTGKARSEITSIGCHTNLWNFPENHYHDWLSREAIIHKLPPLVSSGTVYKVSIPLNLQSNKSFNKTCLVGIGLHDSSAALIPYLDSFPDPFILISTGTWSISMNPFNTDPLTETELQNDCLCYLSFKGGPVKASRLFTGHYHDLQVAKFSEHFQKTGNYFETVEYDPSMYKNPVSEMNAYIAELHNPEINLPPFQIREVSSFKNFEEAYHELLKEIVRRQVLSTKLVMTPTSKERIFVDGGFSGNSIYMHLLATAFSSFNVYAATVSQASAMGAAMVIHEHWNICPSPHDLIELKHYEIQ
jgi:sugar (pentulose or hexulose) kinase